MTSSSTVIAGSNDGHDATHVEDPSPSSTRHNSSAANGAKGASISVSARAAPLAAPPASSVARISFVNTINLEIAVLNRNRSISSVTPLIVFWVSRTSSAGSSASEPRSTASPTAAKTRPSHDVTPGRRFGSPAISFQSMSSSNGPANNMISRIESAPHRSTIGIGSTTFPRDFDIEAPP